MTCCNTNEARFAGANGGAAREVAGTFQPNVDIYETADDWVIAADVPGATKDALEIGFDDGILSVKAAVKDRTPGGTTFMLREYPIGDFERRFRVGDGVDATRISAALDAGVLTIRLPKAESVKPRKIEIRSN
jgi:HSP20 family protein